MTVNNLSLFEEKSFWLRSYGDYTPNPPFAGQAQADVVIIGGGFTGLNTAWQFKQDNPNARVIVLEAAVIGYGASGRNGGFSMKLFGMEPELTVLRWGKQRMIDAHHYMQKAVKHLKTMVEEHDLQSDYRHTGMFRVSYSKQQLKRCQKTYELFQKLGIDDDMSWHTQEELQQEFNSERFLGGMYESETGILNPCKQVRELKRLALSAGVEIYEMIPVTDIDRNGSQIVTQTAEGKITSDKIVLATNAYSRHINGPRKLKNRQMPLWTYQVVTEPLSKEQWNSIGWQQQQSFEDNRQLVHYFRPTVDGRITMGGGDVVTPGDECMDKDFAPKLWQHCENHLKWIYPQLKDVRIDYRWGGPTSVNLDMTPEIGYLDDERMIYATGCIGHGVSLTHLNGRTIADLLNGDKTELTDFWIVNRKAIPQPGNTLSYLGAKTLHAGFKLWDRWDERGLKRS
ncbi:FAD-dependent oxidoreductase [Maricurvus nonylphenolicus]|uniref:NAD(P)/FAD-dependent oxidoreductase n=1 Tax=Maricurvus nonylphenolicus TaxID=1008307 RepID=UPI0036F2590A